MEKWENRQNDFSCILLDMPCYWYWPTIGDIHDYDMVSSVYCLWCGLEGLSVSPSGAELCTAPGSTYYCLLPTNTLSLPLTAPPSHLSGHLNLLSLNWIQIKGCLEIHDISLLFLSFVTTDILSKIIQSLSCWQCNLEIKNTLFIFFTLFCYNMTIIYIYLYHYHDYRGDWRKNIGLGNVPSEVRLSSGQMYCLPSVKLS